MMSLEGWLAIGIVAGVFVLLGIGRIPPYMSIMAGVTVALVAGLITPFQALAGFANEGVVTVAALFVVAAGLGETGAVASLVYRFLGQPKSAVSAQARLIVPVAGFSAFLNNTPIVAILMPVVSDWARRINTAASQLLMPLSFAAILGGLCTLIGTSTNLVVHGLLLDAGENGIGFFQLSRVGIPCAIAGIAYILVFARYLLPRVEDVLAAVEDPREYTLEMVVEPDGSLVGKTIGDAGLRRLPGVYLMEIHRRGFVIAAVGPEEHLEANDQLIFVGVVDSIVELQKIAGLRPATTQLFKLETPREERWFVEAVISASCPIVGKTIRDGKFRSRYSAVVIAVARNGVRINRRIGDIVLQPGDVLLLEALPAFVQQQRNSTDFYLVSRIQGASPPRHKRAGVATTIVVGMVAIAVLGWLTMLQAAAAAAALMLVTRCCSEETARRRIDWQLLIAIAGSFGLGNALTSTGAAEAIAGTMLSYTGTSAPLSLAMVYLLAMTLSGLITNNAAAVVMFPIVMATAHQLGVNHLPFVIGLMVASSASFASPLGYQTNLMVWGPGGYRFRDFIRFGLPLNIVLFVVAMYVLPRAWPF